MRHQDEFDLNDGKNIVFEWSENKGREKIERKTAAYNKQIVSCLKIIDVYRIFRVGKVELMK